MNVPQHALPLPEVSIVSPTYNERTNIRPLVEAIGKAMGAVAWELIVVDDDSPDGTWREVASLGREGYPVRCVRRVGRRGLASAVVEGALSANADIIGVIDADLQHDESLLPKMLEILRTTDADIVIGSRHVEGGGLGDWNERRAGMSSLATQASRLLIGDSVKDPMSGFFMTRRSVFDAVVYDLSAQGYKILLDILTSAPRALKVVELPYVFRGRQSGESKLDISIVAEYVFLLIDKLTKGYVPARFIMFAAIGALGLGVHLSILGFLKLFDFTFLDSQGIATFVTMAFNYALNNEFTYRSQRLKGWAFARGYIIFCAICSLGALANISVANLAINSLHSWTIAGLAGALMSSVFNFSAANTLVWSRKRRPPKVMVLAPAGEKASLPS